VIGGIFWIGALKCRIWAFGAHSLKLRLNMLRKNATTRRKSFLQGLKPVGIAQFTSALKHRPPEEK
jgi:hypothetical protein